MKSIEVPNFLNQTRPKRPVLRPRFRNDSNTATGMPLESARWSWMLADRPCPPQTSAVLAHLQSILNGDWTRDSALKGRRDNHFTMRTGVAEAWKALDPGKNNWHALEDSNLWPSV